MIIIKLNDAFSLKELGELGYFLGVEVTHTSKGMHLCQSKYIKDLLDKIQLHESKQVSTPMATRKIISKCNGEELIDATQYRSVISAL